MKKRQAPLGLWAVVLTLPVGNAMLALSPKAGFAASLGEMLAVFIGTHVILCGITLLLHWGGCRQSAALSWRRLSRTGSRSTGRHPAR